MSEFKRNSERWRNRVKSADAVQKEFAEMLGSVESAAGGAASEGKLISALEKPKKKQKLTSAEDAPGKPLKAMTTEAYPATESLNAQADDAVREWEEAARREAQAAPMEGSDPGIGGATRQSRGLRPRKREVSKKKLKKVKLAEKHRVAKAKREEREGAQRQRLAAKKAKEMELRASGMTKKEARAALRRKRGVKVNQDISKPADRGVEAAPGAAVSKADSSLNGLSSAGKNIHTTPNSRSSYIMTPVCHRGKHASCR